VKVGVRVPPSAPSSQARCPPGSGLSFSFGSHGSTSVPAQSQAHRLCRQAIGSAARPAIPGGSCSPASASRSPGTRAVLAMDLPGPRGQQREVVDGGHPGLSQVPNHRFDSGTLFLLHVQRVVMVSWRTWSGLRPVGAAHIVEYGLALLIDKAGEQLLRVPEDQCPGNDLRGRIQCAEAGDELATHEQ
jgi:hypothetical protein